MKYLILLCIMLFCSCVNEKQEQLNKIGCAILSKTEQGLMIWKYDEIYENFDWSGSNMDLSVNQYKMTIYSNHNFFIIDSDCAKKTYSLLSCGNFHEEWSDTLKRISDTFLGK